MESSSGSSTPTSESSRPFSLCPNTRGAQRAERKMWESAAKSRRVRNENGKSVRMGGLP